MRRCGGTTPTGSPWARFTFAADNETPIEWEIADADERPRARDLGIAPGIFPPGPLNAITDVEGVRVGQTTLIEGDDVRTGATAIIPHPGNILADKVPAGLAVGNGSPSAETDRPARSTRSSVRRTTGS